MENKNIENDEMHVCPWWLAYTFDNALRRLVDPAGDALKEWVRPGMTVMDFGCGFGHYALGAARIVGDNGKVIAVDFQEKMLEIMMKRALKAEVDKIIVPHKCGAHDIGYEGMVDFVVAGNVMHETSDIQKVFNSVFSILNPKGVFFFTEPRYHVKADFFERELEAAEKAGFKVTELPLTLGARRACLVKGD
ncbi:class I SAM-dependent methyltransferase [Desulfovibrio sp. UCD-KL4C]|uniref:class I SAM-dependent methyltransferase n=1 Tax=Desulfovibrio sp. UCD-KL4C TaxID=2578120 RepID=UPI0025C53154|nr:class I SAM-dependent methyltransferase [Desulfovibrio sp. UCD-KL4C]